MMQGKLCRENLRSLAENSRLCYARGRALTPAANPSPLEISRTENLMRSKPMTGHRRGQSGPVRPMRRERRPDEIRESFARRWEVAGDESARVAATRDFVLAAAAAARLVNPGETDRLLAGWSADGRQVAGALLALLAPARSGVA